MELLVGAAIFLLLVVVVLQLAVLKQQANSDTSSLAVRLDGMQDAQDRAAQTTSTGLALSRQEANASAAQQREELRNSIGAFNETILNRMNEYRVQLEKLTEKTEKKLDEQRLSIETKLKEIQTDNATKLEAMRKTVDEKLHETLERRLGESFSLVSKRLEEVQRGLGEMQTLATGVGDLKKVLTNVKARGIWGEMQLSNLLSEVLTPEQYGQNVATKKNGKERVEFAIKLPGKDEMEGTPVWLPIDSKFPREDYERLVDASERADVAAVEEAGKQLVLRIKAEAKDIRDKYIEPPNTTDFAILFLPVEGLYAEVVRRPGLVETLQREYRVNVAGPTTLAALLNCLQMGFRTLAIQKRSSEVWKILGAVKGEFTKFGDIITKIQKKLEEASNVVDDAAKKTNTIKTKLKKVQELPASEATMLLEGEEVQIAFENETGEEIRGK